MAPKLRSQRNLERPAPFRDARLFVIATEGEHTEPLYFRMFQRDERGRHNPRLKIEVLPSTEGQSAPRFLIERLQRFHDEHGLGEGDELWLVMDVDRQGDALREVTREVAHMGGECAVSNPCFELWLLCHLDEHPHELSCKALGARIRAQAPGVYQKNRLDEAFFRRRVQTAIDCAQRHDEAPEAPWPSARGTHVYKLVERLERFRMRSG